MEESPSPAAQLTYQAFGSVAAEPQIDRFWKPWRRLVPFVLLEAFIAFAIVFLFALALREPPAPDPVYGAFERRQPVVRVVLAVILAVLACVVWAVRTRLADTPASGVAAARPGRWTYRGRLVGDGAVQSTLTRSECIWCLTIANAGERFVHASAIALVDHTGSVRVDPAALRLSPKVRVVWDRNGATSECVLRQGEPVTIHGWCGIDDDGQLVLGRHSSVQDRVVKSRPWSAWGRYWAAAHGDGRLQMRLLTATALSIGVLAGLLWVSVFTMQTWVLPDSPERHERIVLPQSTGRLAVSAVAVGAAAVLVAWLIGTVNRIVRLRQQAVYAASVVTVTEVQRTDLINQLAAVTKAAADYAERTNESLADARSDAPQSVDTVSVDEGRPAATASANFTHLQAQLVCCENRIAAAAEFRADATTRLADRVGPIPGLLVRRLARV